MAISLKHLFQSAKGDPADTTLVRPSNWNAEHVITMATAKILGRSTVGTGAVEELSATTAGLALMAAADAAAQFNLIVAPDGVTYAKIQNVTAADRLLGRFTPGAGDIEEVTLGTGISFVGGALTVAPAYPRGFIDGCILSNGTDTTNDINLTAGSCRDSTNVANIEVSANTSGKQLDANWAVSGTTNSGMRNSAAGIANGTYHIYAARTAASSTATIYAHTSAVTATALAALQAEGGGASYIYARRIGSILRESAAIVQFKQNGNNFTRATPKLDVSVTDPGVSAVTRTLSVPLGIKVVADIYILAQNLGTSGAVQSLFTDLDTTDTAPLATLSHTATLYAGAGYTLSNGSVMSIMTNTSGQVRSRMNYSDASVNLYMHTAGWTDARGKDA